MIYNLPMLTPKLSNIEMGYADWKQNLIHREEDQTFLKWKEIVELSILSKWAHIDFPKMINFPKTYSTF